MSYTIILTDEARQDEINSYLYYEMQSAGLGEDFLTDVENCYSIINQHPHLFGYSDNQNKLRDIKLKRFPFIIIFEISGDTVLVYSVHHTSRKPR